MSNRAGVKELAAALAKKNNISQKEAERFVALLFNTVNEGLNSDKMVKLKGLGTFKVTSVSARKSVDVNTGEPIIIDGRDKITFTPDATMRDLVNRPFVQFDTVVINDGVDIDVLEKIDSETEDETEGVADVPEQQLPASADEEAVVVEPVLEETTHVETSETESSTAEEVETVEDADVQQSAQNDETEDDPRLSVEQMSVLNIENEFDVDTELQLTPEQLSLLSNGMEGEEEQSLSAEQVQQEDNETQESETEEVEESEPDNSFVEELLEEIEQKRKKISMLTVALVVLIIGIAVGVWYSVDNIQLKEHRISHLETMLKSTTVRKKVVKPAPVSTKTEEKNTDAVSPEAEKQSTDKQDAATKKEETPTESYDDDARVRTGAYRIVGIAQIVKARKGQTLHDISRIMLGSGMECYVEAVNGGNIELKEGQDVKIPKLQLKKRKR